MSAGAYVVSAKVRALYGRRLTPNDFTALMHAHSVAELASYLKNNTVYGTALADINEATLHRGYLETLLRRFRLERLASLSQYESMTHMPLSEMLIRQGEIAQLLLFLRLLGAGRPEKYFFDLPYYFNRHASIDLIGLSEVHSFEELLTLLDGTVYARPLRQFPPDKQGKLRIPELEAAFYSDWYEEFFARIDKHTHGEEHRQLTELLSQQLCTRNVLRIYRLKTYFHMPPAEIRMHLLGNGHDLSDKRLNRLLEAPPDEVLALFRKMPEGKALPAAHFDELARLRHHIIAYRARHYIHFSVYPSVVLLAYMFVSDAELDDIINIIEGIRYGLPPEQIRRLLTVS